MVTLYKVLDGTKPCHGGAGRYPGVGRWTRHLDPDGLRPCRYGFHLVDGTQLLGWIGPTVYEAEPCPDHEPVDGDGKLVTCRVRLVGRLAWDEKVARRFVADVAEAALLGERACGREPAPASWRAVEVARAYADGDATYSELVAARAAAREAAKAAARAAAKAAARDAAKAAARDAAKAAARDAAKAAARDAAKDAARDAAKDAAWGAIEHRLHLPPVTSLYEPKRGEQP